MTFEELKAYIDSIEGKYDYEKYDDLFNRAVLKYAEENEDEWLKMSVEQSMGLRPYNIPWGQPRIIEFTIFKDKKRKKVAHTVIWNYDEKTLEGPEEIVQRIKDENERLRGKPDYDRFVPGTYEYAQFYAPPGNLWNFNAIIPLMARIFDEKIMWIDLDSYPKDPLESLMRELFPHLGIMLN